MSILVVKNGVVAADTLHIVDISEEYSLSYMSKLMVNKGKWMVLGYTGDRIDFVKLFTRLERSIKRGTLSKTCKNIFKNDNGSSIHIFFKNFYIVKSENGSYKKCNYNISHISGVGSGSAIHFMDLPAVEVVKRTIESNKLCGGDVTYIDCHDLEECPYDDII